MATRLKVNIPEVKTSFFAFNGGLDLVTPPIEMPKGVLRSCSNVELAINGGISRLAGYERYSGKAKPSDAIYAILTCTITGTVNLGDVLTDNAGTSFGTVIALPTGQAVLTLITGAFSTGNIKVGAVTVGTCVGAQTTGSASTPALNATYMNLAADVYRALIAVVPGEGNILGVWQYADNVYAFRNNVGSTLAVMHKASASGWVAVTMYNEVAFTVGSGAATIIDGGTLTQGGVTATIQRVVVRSGSLASGTAAGQLIITNPTGGNFGAGAATVGAGTLTLTAIQTAISFLPSGRFEFDNWNFGGGAGTKKMYGCDGVNRGFEFDGTTLVPLITGMPLDKPVHVRQHKNHLFFAFSGSAQHSGTGNPYAWTILSGAGELACGDTISGFVELAGTAEGGAMALYTRNRTLVLYGNDAADWNLVTFSEEAGSLPYTSQFIAQAITLDDRGIALLSAVQNYGNFTSAVMSEKIKPSLNDLIANASASCIVRKKNQYRVFFGGGSAFYATFGNANLAGGGTQFSPLGITKISLTAPVLCITSQEGLSGQEEIYFGSSDGYVYQMDIGTSFDGEAIVWNAELAYNHFGSPRLLKQFRKAVTEISGGGYASFSFSYTIGYGTTEFDASPSSNITSTLSSVTWDTFVWDQFFWDGRTLAPSESDITGTAENLSLYYSGSSDEFAPFTLNGAIVHFTHRRQMR